MDRLVKFLTWSSGKQRLILIFLFCALPTGLYMAMNTPLGQVPDEPAHMARAESLLRVTILGVRKPVINPKTGERQVLTGFKVDAGLFAVSFPKSDWIENKPTITQKDYFAVRNDPPDHRLVFAHAPNTATYFPAAYIPGSIGLAIGLATQATPFACMVMGRIGMVIGFLILGCLALWMAAYGEGLILTVLLLPMTLFLAGSLSQDGVLVGVACLCAAAFTHDPEKKPGIRIFGLILLVIILMAKLPYVPLLGLAFVPLRRLTFIKRSLEAMLATAPVMIWALLIALFVVVPFGTAPYHPGPLYTGDPRTIFTTWDTKENFHILLADPARFITLPIELIQRWHTSLIDQTIGVLGSMALWLPDRYYAAWEFAIMASVFGFLFVPRSDTERKIVLMEGAYVALVLILSAWAVFIAAYIDWTDVGSPEIWGVQGRYFLVLMPFFVLVIPRLFKMNLPIIVPVLPAIVLGIYDLGYLPLKISTFFYVY